MTKHQRESKRKERREANRQNRRNRVEAIQKRMTAVAIREPEIIHCRQIVITPPEPNPQVFMLRLLERVLSRGF